MAPVVCMTDFSMQRGETACPYSRRRPGHRTSSIPSGKHRVAESRQKFIDYEGGDSPHSTQPSSPISEADKPIKNCFPDSPESSLCARIPIDSDDRWIFMRRRQGLLNIVSRTIALVRRNHILEKKVEALRLETRSDIDFLLNNPANKTKNVRRREESKGRSRDSEIDERVSSSTDGKFTWLASVSTTPAKSPRKNFCTDHTLVTSTCNSTSLEDETQSSDTLDR